MKLIRVCKLVACLMILLFSVSCGPVKTLNNEMQQVQDKTIKVAFVYTGTVGGMGWTYAHEMARINLEKELPYVTTTKIESVSETDKAEHEKVLTKLAQENNVIFVTSYTLKESINKVSPKFPNVIFMHAAGAYETEHPNVATYGGSISQSRYLAGIVAGKMTKTNTIGFLAAVPAPSEFSEINAFTLGIRSVNPKAVVKVVWAMTYYDPIKEKALTNSLFDAGADIITQETESIAPCQAAEERGKWAIGYCNDMRIMAPNAVLTSAVWNFGTSFVEVVKKMQEGMWKNERYEVSITNGGVDLATFGPMVPDEVIKLVETKRQMMKEGTFDVFIGPIKDRDGTLRVAQDQQINKNDISLIDWFVKGVEGAIPTQQ